VENCFRR